MRELLALPYKKYKRYFSAAALTSGFMFDVYFFRRVDLPFENIAIILHFVVGFLAIVLLHAATIRLSHEKYHERATYILPLVIQLAIGGLFGKFFIFFYLSGSILVSWQILFVLLFLTVANESARTRYTQLNFNLAIFYGALLVYLAMVIPVVTNNISATTFILSGLISIAVIFSIIHALRYFSNDGNKSEDRKLTIIIIATYIIFNTLYFFNVLPPIPLSLKDAGLYHQIIRIRPGVYQAIEEKKDFLLPFNTEVFHRFNYEPVYIFTAIFAPADFNLTISHIWQKKGSDGRWITEQRIPIEIRGGRDDGYRGYSLRSNIELGDWRVNVETDRGQLLGRINFIVEQTVIPHSLQNIEL